MRRRKRSVKESARSNSSSLGPHSALSGRDGRGLGAGFERGVLLAQPVDFGLQRRAFLGAETTDGDAVLAEQKESAPVSLVHADEAALSGRQRKALALRRDDRGRFGADDGRREEKRSKRNCRG